MRGTALERIEAKYIPEPNSGCWLWLGAVSASGYGSFSFEGRITLAHRASWAIFTGNDISDIRIKICHTCDNKLCINPEHLWEGSQKQNMRDCFAKGRMDGRPAQPGSLNGMAVLSEDAVLTILEQLHAGKHGRVIAAKVGVAETTISMIKGGKNWPHVYEQWQKSIGRKL